MHILFSPLEQFSINGLDLGFITITNMAISIIISVILIIKLVGVNTQVRFALISDNVIILIVDNVQKMISSMIGRKGDAYVGLLLTLMITISVFNLLGNSAYGFAITAHLTTTIGLSVMLLFSFTLIGLIKWLSKFPAIFLPQGTPILLSPLLVVIETISYLARAFSLGIRLAANIMAGHSLLHIIISFYLKFVSSAMSISLAPYFLVILVPVMLLLPTIFIIALYIMELVIAVLQAYVFTLLSLSYLGNVLHLN